jgi:shikimate dehydrogenase
VAKEKTKLFCLIGYPVGHSLSPVMHNAAFSSKKIDAFYIALPVKDLKKDLGLIRDAGFSGLNITMPHKEKILRYASVLSAEVKATGAANTGVIRKGKLSLYNTDYTAAKKLISRRMKARGKKALVIGAGGAGKAIACALKNLGADVYIANKSLSKAQQAARKLGVRALKKETFEKNPEKFPFAIIANATPVGMGKFRNMLPCSSAVIRNAALAYEAVYSPPKTKFLREAEKNGLRTINGLDMLLEQGYEAFRIFTGKEAPKKLMRQVILKELEK